MYLSLLVAHNLMRWVTLAMALWALGRAYYGWMRRRPWTGADQRAGRWFAMALSLQLLIGGLFYCLPGSLAQVVFVDPGAVLRTPPLRFFVLEHSLQMLVALGLAHAGTALARRGATHRTKHRRAALFFTAALAITLIAIPWPFLDYGWPLIRLGGG